MIVYLPFLGILCCVVYVVAVRSVILFWCSLHERAVWYNRRKIAFSWAVIFWSVQSWQDHFRSVKTSSIINMCDVVLNGPAINAFVSCLIITISILSRCRGDVLGVGVKLVWGYQIYYCDARWTVITKLFWPRLCFWLSGDWVSWHFPPLSLVCENCCLCLYKSKPELDLWRLAVAALDF